MRAACARLAAFNLLAPRDPAARPGRDIAFGSDPRQRLDVYTPERVADPAPVVVFFYGGSRGSGRGPDYALVGRALGPQGIGGGDRRLPDLSPGPLSSLPGGRSGGGALDMRPHRGVRRRSRPH